MDEITKNNGLYFKSNVSQSGYSNSELATIYELGRFFSENGDIYKAETIFNGLLTIAPSFVPAWLGIAYVYFQNEKYELALKASKQACELMPDSMEAILYCASCLLTLGDYNSAGTYLGEVSDMLEKGVVVSPNIQRFYRIQLARFNAHT